MPRRRGRPSLLDEAFFEYVNTLPTLAKRNAAFQMANHWPHFRILAFYRARGHMPPRRIIIEHCIKPYAGDLLRAWQAVCATLPKDSPLVTDSRQEAMARAISRTLYHDMPPSAWKAGVPVELWLAAMLHHLSSFCHMHADRAQMLAVAMFIGVHCPPRMSLADDFASAITKLPVWRKKRDHGRPVMRNRGSPLSDFTTNVRMATTLILFLGELKRYLVGFSDDEKPAPGWRLISDRMIGQLWQANIDRFDPAPVWWVRWLAGFGADYRTMWYLTKRCWFDTPIPTCPVKYRNILLPGMDAKHRLAMFTGMQPENLLDFNAYDLPGSDAPFQPADHYTPFDVALRGGVETIPCPIPVPKQDNWPPYKRTGTETTLSSTPSDSQTGTETTLSSTPSDSQTGTETTLSSTPSDWSETDTAFIAASQQQRFH